MTHPARAPEVSAAVAPHAAAALATPTPDAPGANAAVAVPIPVAARPLYELAADDPSLHASALGNNAHVTLDAGRAGELSLHLRIRDGVADVRFEGDAARSLDIRSHEVRTALAGEGLALGRFETGNPGVGAGAGAGGSHNSSSQHGSSGGNAGGQTTQDGNRGGAGNGGTGGHGGRGALDLGGQGAGFGAGHPGSGGQPDARPEAAFAPVPARATAHATTSSRAHQSSTPRPGALHAGGLHVKA